jgi:UDP-2,3-diacylglucosamine pyrophosphatase LpxH
MVRDFFGSDFGEMEIRNHAIHTTDNGKRLLVLHDDEFGNTMRCHVLMYLVENGLLTT